MKPEIKKRIEQIQNGQAPKGYKKTKLGIVPSEWDVKQLKHILDQIERKVPKPKQGYWRLGLRSHAKGTFYEFVNDPDAVAMEELFTVAENDLIVNITFAWEHAIALANQADEGKLVSHRFPTYRFNEKACPYFYKYYVIQPHFKKMLSDISPGGAGRNRVMSKNSFQKLFVLFPPLTEQEKIAEILLTWDKALRLKELLIAEKKQLKKWLMQNLLTGKKRLPSFCDEWKDVRLEDICTLNDNVLSENTQSNFEFSYIDLSSVERGKITLPLIAIKFEELPSRARRLFKKDDILMSTVRPYLLGFAYIDKEYNYYVCSTGFAVVRAREGICSKYIYHLLFSDGVIRQINQCLMGTNYPALNNNDVNQLYFELPSLPEQIAIAEVLSTADREIGLHEKQLEEQKKQKKALMQLLLTGIVRVYAREVS